MSNIVLATKWRPKLFSDLIGQDPVVTALINSLDNQRLHHTYLFTGTRGVGKTTFIRYLINGFQRKNKLKLSEVTSPTFNILNEYQIKKIKINHYDLFRLKLTQEVKNLGLFEDSPNSITLIEWPQIIKEKPKNLIELYFKYEDDHKKRSVIITGLD